ALLSKATVTGAPLTVFLEASTAVAVSTTLSLPEFERLALSTLTMRSAVVLATGGGVVPVPVSPVPVLGGGTTGSPGLPPPQETREPATASAPRYFTNPIAIFQ